MLCYYFVYFAPLNASHSLCANKIINWQHHNMEMCDTMNFSYGKSSVQYTCYIYTVKLTNTRILKRKWLYFCFVDRNAPHYSHSYDFISYKEKKDFCKRIQVFVFEIFSYKRYESGIFIKYFNIECVLVGMRSIQKWYRFNKLPINLMIAACSCADKMRKI